MARLTAGWQQAGRAATLREHVDRYGPMPPVGRRGPSSIIDQVAEAGLTGRGGAGFPTGTKMRSVASRRGPAVVVANGMESEPASEKDQALLARAPHLVLDGISLAAEAVGASEAHLCLALHRNWLTDIVATAVGERMRARIDRIPVTLHGIPERYTASEESSLVHWLNGGEAKPTKTPPRPFEKGVGKRPTLLDNVETLSHVALIARYGAQWFRQAGRAGAAGSMLTTVTGAVARPGVYEVESGSRVGDILALAGADGGGSVLVGGYFGTWHEVNEVATLPLTLEGLKPVGSSPGAGILFVLSAEQCGLAEAARILRYLASQGAEQCGPCMFGLPAIAGDLSQLAAGRPNGDALGRLQRRFGVISGRGACKHPDGAVRMATSALKAFAADADAHARRRRCLARPQPRGGRPAARPAMARSRVGGGR
ncbi:MAG: SLBB domain-containing protein [Actinobacteria bacterium]|nr:SLBB domain-containing protein [Actinomycetota bacterium]